MHFSPSSLAGAPVENKENKQSVQPISVGSNAYLNGSSNANGNQRRLDTGHRYPPPAHKADEVGEDNNNDVDYGVIINDEVVMEEPEYITQDTVPDAGCLLYDSFVMIKPRALSDAETLCTHQDGSIPGQHTKKVQLSGHNINNNGDTQHQKKDGDDNDNEDDEDDTVVSVSGPCLGRAGECFRIARSFGGSALSSSTAKIGSDRHVRYGEMVSLYLPCTRRYLGVREHHSVLSVGFFRNNFGDPATWEILHGNRMLLVGPASTNTKRKQPPGCTHYVRSGEAIVLRNKETGGLISIRDGAVVLLTDSYEKTNNMSARTKAATVPISGLSEQLLDHDRMVPTVNEELALIRASVPPCPDWIFDETESTPTPGATTTTAAVAPTSSSASLPVHTTSMSDNERDKIGKMLVQEQERRILDEVIGSLMGLEGRLIVIDSDTHAFHIDGSVVLERSMTNLVDKILGLSSAYLRVRDFIRSRFPGYETGSIMQALCECMDGILEEYLETVCNVETRLKSSSAVLSRPGPVSLSRLHAELQGAFATLSLLDRVATGVQKLSGGALLNELLHMKSSIFAGDSYRQYVLNRLLEKASGPYMAMLSMWLHRGVLKDPYGEFMIGKLHSRQQSKTPDLFDGDSWNSIFVIAEEHVLTYVSSPVNVAEKVLTAGKYWNAVLYCHRMSNVEAPTDPTLEFEEVPSLLSDPAAIVAHVNHLYRKASYHLLRLLLNDFRIGDTLLTMKRYFLLDQSDFLMHFLDAADQELQRRVEDVSKARAQHWLSMAVQLTEGVDDERNDATDMSDGGMAQPVPPECLRCYFAPESLTAKLGIGQTDHNRTPSRQPFGEFSTLTGIVSFTLDFPKVPFPTCLVLSKRNLADYQLLFRNLLLIKHVEQKLVGVWLGHQTMKRFQDVRTGLGPTLLLRQRMLHFVQNYIYYLMLEVIEPNWITLQKQIASLQTDWTKADASGQSTVDDLITYHTEFLDKTLERCLLTNDVLIRCVMKLVSTCMLFADQMKRFADKTGLQKVGEEFTKTRSRGDLLQRRNKENGSSAKDSSHLGAVKRELSNSMYKQMVRRYEDVFNSYMVDFVKKLREDSLFHSHLSNLCTRLDYNGYITQKMKEARKQEA